MALPLIQLIPLITAVTKQIATKPKTMIKEISVAGIGSSVYFIIQDLAGCSGESFIELLACIPLDHWTALMVSVSALLARLNSKRSEA
jgi:hypothetical protein